MLPLPRTSRAGDADRHHPQTHLEQALRGPTVAAPTLGDWDRDWHCSHTITDPRTPHSSSASWTIRGYIDRQGYYNAKPNLIHIGRIIYDPFLRKPQPIVFTEGPKDLSAQTCQLSL